MIVDTGDRRHAAAVVVVQPSEVDEEVPMPEVLYTDEQVARRGETLFEERIRPDLDEQEHGKFLVVDIETGDYELDADELQALKRAKAKNPRAVLYMLRFGYPTAYRLGRRAAVAPS